MLHYCLHNDVDNMEGKKENVIYLYTIMYIMKISLRILGNIRLAKTRNDIAYY